MTLDERMSNAIENEERIRDDEWADEMERRIEAEINRERDDINAMEAERENEKVMNYRIAPDANSWNIEERRVTGEKSKLGAGVESWVAVKYYGKLEHAAAALLDIVARDKATKTELDTAAILAAITEARRDVFAHLKELKS